MRFARNLPFLSADELIPVWARLRAQECQDDTSRRSLLWIDLLEAVSRREMTIVSIAADELLSVTDLSTASRRFLLTAKAMALIATADYEVALQLIHDEDLIDDQSHLAAKLLHLYALDQNRITAGGN